MHKEHEKHEVHYRNLKITKLPQSEIEIEGEITAEETERCRVLAIKELSKSVNVPGFRKGKIPESVLISKLGETAIMEETAEIALSHEYQHIVIDNKLNVIGRPQIILTKAAKGNPLGFKIKVAIFPEVTMPDYKKLAAKEVKVKETVEVTDKEIDAVIEEIRKAKVKDEKDALPEFNDEFVKSLGAFENIADFKKKVKENMLAEKEQRAKEKKRVAIGEAIVNDTKMETPAILVASELAKMTAQMKDDIARMGLKFEDYLKHIKKTEAELHTDWKDDAEKRVKLQVVINKIAIEEKLLPEEAEVEKEVSHILEHHKDADPDRVRNYVETIITNEKVFQFLETQGEEQKEKKEVKEKKEPKEKKETKEKKESK